MSQIATSSARLLLIEDDPDLLFPVQGVLEEEGYTVTPALSLPASLSVMEEQLFHLVVTDLFAPTSQEPLQSIHPLLQHAAPTPVGVLTAWPVSPEAAAEAGVAWVLRKPFELDELVQTVQRALQPSRSRPLQMQVVEAFFAALSARDWPSLTRLCTPDVVVRSLAAPAVTAVDAPTGLFAARALLEQRFSTLPGYTIDAVRVYRRPLGVAARYQARWEGRDGLVHQVAGSMHFRFQGERIAQIEGAF